jgi:hypothetical protein
MTNRAFALGIVAALGLAALSGDVSAKGFGWHTSHHAFGRRAYGIVGGYAISEAPVSYVSTPQMLGPLIAPSLAVSCHHSRETVTVPSEEGGAREISVTRC